MRFGLFASILLHLSVVVTILNFRMPFPARGFEAEPTIPIEFIREAELDLTTSIPAAAPEPEPEPEIEEPEPEIEAPPAPIEEPEPEVAAPEPAPAPAAVEIQPEPEAEPPAPQETPTVKPKPEPAELDFDALSRLIDKEREDERAAEPSQTPSQPTETAETERRAVGAGDRLSASLEAKIKSVLSECWNSGAIIGAPEPERLVVVIDFELNRDGSLASSPRVANELQINLSGNRFWKVAQREAVGAVVKCAPYDFLPPDQYETWKEFRFNFNPSEMVGF